jgi:hypothetical protein
MAGKSDRERQLEILENTMLGEAEEARLLEDYADSRRSFDYYAALEPRLLALRDEAQAFKRESEGKDAVCANGFWYRNLKPRLVELVGFDRPIEGEVVREPISHTEWLSEFLEHAEADGRVRSRLIAKLPREMQSLYGVHAYDVCYEAIYDELPDCKNCNCW